LTTTDKLGRKKTLTLDPVITAKLEEADEIDKKEEERVEANSKILSKKSDFGKIMDYNDPKILIIPALIAVAITGFCQPFFGWIFSKLIQIMTFPIAYMKVIHGDNWDIFL